jgi:hypothetical protein
MAVIRCHEMAPDHRHTFLCGANGHFAAMGEDTNSTIPEPKVDPDPDPGNEAGGVDAVPENGTFPPVPPDEPMSAQMADEKMPDEIQEQEAPDRDADTEDPSSEPSG